MIHIATVHHKSDKWIDVQLKYIDRYINQPYRIYAFLNGIKEDYSSKFYYSSKDEIESHAEKLNLLAKKICSEANDSDILFFIDGDAFPIKNLSELLETKLTAYPLIAIKRSVDFGDCQPHPSFTATTIGFWKKINGDWSQGYKWKNEINQNHITDVGGNLLKVLEDNKISWYPLERTNKNNIHPQWFGVYDNLIYHHGAGFRKPLSKVDRYHIKKTFTKLDILLSKIILIRRIPYIKTIKENDKLSSHMFDSIQNDYEFYKKL